VCIIAAESHAVVAVFADIVNVETAVSEFAVRHIFAPLSWMEIGAFISIHTELEVSAFLNVLVL
jgi:hypothetical protein